MGRRIAEKVGRAMSLILAAVLKSKNDAGVDRATPSPCARLPLSAARRRFARQARSGVSAAGQNHRRARLLLAFARVQALPDSRIAAFLLGRQTLPKRSPRQGVATKAAPRRLEGAHHLGMSNGFATDRRSARKNPFILVNVVGRFRLAVDFEQRSWLC